MSDSFSIKADFRNLDKLIDEYDGDATEALEKVAIQMLTWFNNGSTKESRKPPIRFGILRGSSSAFVGGKHVGDFQAELRPGSEESPTPNHSHSGEDKTIVLGWNTEYATRMHEWEGNWGEYTQRDGDAGNKWAEKHAMADKEIAAEMLANELGKNMGTK